MILLSLDQSSRTSGYAVFDDDKLITYGKFTIDDDDVGTRLYKIRNKIQSLINQYSVEYVIFEDIQLQNNVLNNVATFKVLAEVFGVIYELLTELKIPNEAVLSTVWKSTLNIKGKTRPEQKKAAQNYIFEKYNLKPTQDEADAICIGLHFLNIINTQDYDWSE